MTILTDTPVAGIDDQPNENTKLMIALDVDGTLVDHDGHMTQEVRSAAQAVVAKGHDVMIATGRSLNATLPIIQQIGMERGYAVCCNGGVTLRLDPALESGYEIIHKATFDPAPALKALRERLPNAKYALEDEDGNFLSTERFQDASFGVESIGVDFQTMLDATAVRVVVFSSENTSEEFNEAIRHIGLSGVTYSVGWTAWLDIAAEGVTKASALEALRRRLGTDQANTVAVGDGRNDIEMLTWAGRGIAMGQAPDEVLAVADEVTASVLDDGAALVLRGLL
ncbi:MULTISPECIES: Cof-type HAD-IIB family hydrolase [Paenarthrobacter]|jgi:Cof subfamily protein (haloacid dehalogenase superfamily)|uniref:Cof-type HAD-IIB family hydrolase n=1 Tax=Paenarthrobacter TaxID=1742992 RepID=UPI00057EF652|nr:MULTISPECIES: Cof-type HAD-IIB family hydrolase [Paenarthrobacter]KQQ98881.1 HAD family hydrolase [Arthrobacter sp. Leaf145]SKB79986.1 Cof subfamily of IIB subfamily of haloacid dehalogenase superfamily/HAD-superfamily hydrolase, subfamily IIB [Arthrobacter sp. 31Cvi3.1E]BCW08843.1 haloacid dehalogenase [Arthrobacter sp. NtRootA2]BCW17034.1 haloacid dehalogenase [Arthrobacter sp. NtRootA4]BCW21258.1 haloacid dehalogenase [Arthrobacter sp. NtRootC7]BCW25525.1 haloacid dehalogenase [Arthroba